MRFYVRLASVLGTMALAGAALADGGVQTGASLELNFTHNFNRPTSSNTALGYPGSQNQNGYYFNRRTGNFAVNLAEVRVFKNATDASRTGFSLRIIDGEAAKQLAANIPGLSTTLVYEAVARALMTDRITLDVGIFPTWIGVEGIGVGNGQYLSRSFQKGQFQPFYHSGVKVGYTLGDSTTMTIAAVNAFNGTERSTRRRDLNLGFQIARTVSETESLTINGLEAKDEAMAGLSHDIFNLVYTNKLDEKTTLAVDASTTTDSASGQRVRGVGFGGYLTRTLSDGNVLGLRGEFLRESRAGGRLLAFGGSRKPSLSSITASYELKNEELKGLRTLIELRFDNANAAIFPTKTGAKKSQTTLSLVQAFQF